MIWEQMTSKLSSQGVSAHVDGSSNSGAFGITIQRRFMEAPAKNAIFRKISSSTSFLSFFVTLSSVTLSIRRAETPIHFTLGKKSVPYAGHGQFKTLQAVSIVQFILWLTGSWIGVFITLPCTKTTCLNPVVARRFVRFKFYNVSFSWEYYNRPKIFNWLNCMSITFDNGNCVFINRHNKISCGWNNVQSVFFIHICVENSQRSAIISLLSTAINKTRPKFHDANPRLHRRKLLIYRYD